MPYFFRYWLEKLLADPYSLSISNTYSQSVSTNVTYNVANGGSAQGENNGNGKTSYTFNTSISQSASKTISINYDKDVFINSYILEYCDENQMIPDPTGVWNSDGTYMTWDGYVPGWGGPGDQGVKLYFHFHIEE